MYLCLSIFKTPRNRLKSTIKAIYVMFTSSRDWRYGKVVVLRAFLAGRCRLLLRLTHRLLKFCRKCFRARRLTRPIYAPPRLPSLVRTCIWTHVYTFCGLHNVYFRKLLRLTNRVKSTFLKCVKIIVYAAFMH